MGGCVCARALRICIFVFVSISVEASCDWILSVTRAQIRKKKHFSADKWLEEHLASNTENKTKSKTRTLN